MPLGREQFRRSRDAPTWVKRNDRRPWGPLSKNYFYSSSLPREVNLYTIRCSLRPPDSTIPTLCYLASSGADTVPSLPLWLSRIMNLTLYFPGGTEISSL